MKVKIKKLNENAVIPSYSKYGDAGMDLTATSMEVTGEIDQIYPIGKNEYKFIEYGTSISIEIPDGHVGLVFPRSSISKTGLTLANSVGVIDSGYRGEIKCRFKYLGGAKYEIGDRIAQIMIIPHPVVQFEEVLELSTTERGEGGFGSTNN